MLIDDVDEFSDLILYLWNKFHEHGILPRQWQVAEGAQIGKQNGRKGCAAVRLINILDPGEDVCRGTMGGGQSTDTELRVRVLSGQTT